MPEIDSSGISTIGLVRQDNQDAIHLPSGHQPAERGLLYALADGMGGHAHGGVASALALEKVSEALTRDPATPSLKMLRRGVELANLAVFQRAHQLNAGRMGTTLTAACLDGNTLYLAHVGDSRAYLIRGRRAICLTNDHTTVGELVRLKVLKPEQVRTHAQRSILTKAIGVELFVQPDIAKYPLQEGDCLVLCSDGVWSVIQDDEFAELAATTKHARELNQKLIDLALERESDDNASAITVFVQSTSVAPAENARKFARLSLRNLFSKRQDPILCSSSTESS